MVNDHRHLLSGKHTRYRQLVTRAEIGIVRKILVYTLSSNIQHLEETRVVQESHIHATAIGTIMVNDLVMAILDLGLTHEILQHCNVLNLADTNDNGTNSG